MKYGDQVGILAVGDAKSGLIRQAKEELARSNVQNFFSSMAELGYSKDDAISMANELKE